MLINLTALHLDSSHLFHYRLANLAYFQEIMELVMPYLEHHMWYPCSTAVAPTYSEMWTPLFV